MNNKTYLQKTHMWGRFWSVLIFLLICSFPFLLCLIYKSGPKWDGLWEGILAVCPLYCAVGLIELFTYLPMLGNGATYMAFITGNIANLKLPCALDALDKAGLKASSEEGECISTIAIATSNIVTTFVIVLGVLLIVPLKPILTNPILDPAFTNMLPALFGGLAVFFISKNVKVAIFPMILMLILFIAIPGLNVSIMVPVGVIFSIVCTRIMYKKGVFDDKKAKE